MSQAGRPRLISLSWIPGEAGEAVRHPIPTTSTVYKPPSLAEYVNAQEPSMDMKSVTDRAAQTLLWTELIRGGPWGRGWVGWG